MEKLDSLQKVSPRIIDVSEPKKVDDIKMALTGKESIVVLQRRILNDIRRIVQRCDAENYPNCVLGVSEDGYREIRWPGVRVIVDASEDGEVFGKVSTLKSGDPLIFFTEYESEFDKLIRSIGSFLMFRVSKPVDIVVKHKKVQRDCHYGITLPVKLEKHIGCDSPENFPFHFDFDEDMSKTV